jgi:formamidopyrimidine-DNA glycosylase
MPELPELEIYRERLLELAKGPVRKAELKHFFTVRTYTPPFTSLEGQSLVGAQRRGKLLVLSFERAHAVIHLKLAGRLHWKKAGTRQNGKFGCWKLEFDSGGLHMTESSTKKMASVHLVERLEDYPEWPTGADPLAAGFSPALRGQLKSALTDQSIVTGIGNAYSDEILFEARLSPVKLAEKLNEEERARLLDAVPRVLREWIDRVRASCTGLPDDQPVWRSQMKVHGKFKEPCPVCGTRIERISYAERETHYCPRCQTGGRILADRRYSRFVK